jgi:serine/threonine-protein kinase
MADNFSVPPGGMQARLEPGSRVGPYVIEQRIGSGGMAVVFSARDESLGRMVALKVLSPSLAHDEEFRQRFLRESRTIAMVEEPHIVPVYGAGESDGVLYIATRLVPGGDLATLMRQEMGPFAPDRAVSLITQIAAALDAAHHAGLVHRDVKPSNVLIDRTPGRPEHAYLSDFGLSKTASSNTSLTAAGTFLGTPDYCAPEQVTGSPPASARSDQYSLACVAFSLLAGVVPYGRADSMATLFAHVQAPIPSLAALRPGLSPAVDAVIARALAKDPAARFGSCAEFAAALAASLRAFPGAPVPAPGPQWGQAWVPQPAQAFAPPPPWTPPGQGQPAFGGPSDPNRQITMVPGPPFPDPTHRLKPGLSSGKKAIIAGSAAAAVVIAAIIAGVLTLNHPHTTTLQAELTGSWTGSYTCTQGLTDFQLAIQAAPDGTAAATVNFYPDPSNPNVPSGEYTMTGTYSASGMALIPSHWVHQPPNYLMVPFDAGPLTSDGKTLSGTIPASGCTTFTAGKSS